MRVKMFWKKSPEHPLNPYDGVDKILSFRNAQDLEDEINAWLSQNPKIKVIDIKQSANGDMGMSLWLISVWYDEAA